MVALYIQLIKFQNFLYLQAYLSISSFILNYWPSLFQNFVEIEFCYNKFVAIVDTQFCTHDLIKENDLNDHPCTTKIMIVTCINLFLHYMHQLVFALHALIHSLHIIKIILWFQWSQRCFRFSNWTIGSKDIAWSSLYDQYALCLGKVNHTWSV